MKKIFILFITVLVFLLAACTSQPSVIAPTSIPSTATQIPATPAPTQTALPANTETATPEPTQTSVPPTPTVEAPAKVKEVLNDVEVVRVENFQKTYSGLFDYGNGVTAAGDGQLNMQGIPFWTSSFRGKNPFSEGSGIILSYKYSLQSEFEIFFDRGNWGDKDYRRFGVYGANPPAANLFQGAQGLGFNYLTKNFALNANTWYTILLTTGKGGEFLALIWDPEKPERVARYHEVIKKWENNTWNFTGAANKGKIQFKDYMEITFSGFKKK
jgi:hypothetical protein